jgi:hypothetical protein
MKIILSVIVSFCLILLCGCATPESTSTCHGGNVHDWEAWNNVMPGSGKSFHLIGKVTVNTGGWKAELVKRAPQGFNPQILMLDLKVTPPDGIVTQVITELDVRYTETGVKYKQAQVFCNGDAIALLEVKDVH